MKKYLIIIGVILVLLIATFADSDNTKYLKGFHHAEIIIKDYGTIKLKLDADTAPITVTNFVNLANEGFYDNLTFHRVMEGFMIQGGAPNKESKEIKTIKGEFKANNVENNISHVRGVISMARTDDPNSASSQFFIVHQDSIFLDGNYAAFGHVTEGIEIVDKIVEDMKQKGYTEMVNIQDQPVITTIKITD